MAASPNNVPQGQQGVAIVLTGHHTSFLQGVTTADFGPGITVVSLAVTSGTGATAVIDIDPAATLGPRPLQLTTNGELSPVGKIVSSSGSGTPISAFSVRAAHPSLEVNPTDVPRGQQGVTITLTGHDTSFQQGVTTADFGAGITVVSLTVNSGTAATAVINIDPAATLGPRALQLTTNSEHAPVGRILIPGAGNPINAFSVRAANPHIEATPNNVPEGQQGVTIVLTGYDTSFQPGVTTADFGPGITVVSLTVNSGTAATAVINVDPAATLGPRPLQLATNNEHAYALIISPGMATPGSAFSVRPSNPHVAANPTDVPQGQQGVTIALTGYDTSFQPDVTTADFGSGITVVSLTINSGTAATAVINVDPGARVGPRPLQLTTNNEHAYALIMTPGVTNPTSAFSVRIR